MRPLPRPIRLLKKLPERFRWSLALVVLAVGAVPWLAGSPAAAAPQHPRTVTDDADDAQAFSFCQNLQDVLDLLPFDASFWGVKSLDMLETGDLPSPNAIPVPPTWKLALKFNRWVLGFFTGESHLDDPIQWFRGWTRQWNPNWGADDNLNTSEGLQNHRNLDSTPPQWMITEVRGNFECGISDKRPHKGCADARASWGTEDYEDPGWFDDKCWGDYPIRNYDLGYNQGLPNERAMSDFGGWLTNLAFDIGKTTIQFGLTIVGWGFTFDFRQFNGQVIGIADNYQVHLIGDTGIGLEAIFFYCLIAWTAFMIMFRRAGAAIGEFGVSMVLIALVVFFHQHRETYLNTVWDAMDSGSYVILVAGNEQAPENCGGPSETPCADAAKAALMATQGHIHQMFVVEPYDYINWGGSLQRDGKEACRIARNQIVSIGPHEESSWPRRHMYRAGCKKEAKWNNRPGGWRLLYAVASAIVSVMVGVMLIMSGGTLLFAKFMVAVLFILAPFALPFLTLPGEARRVGWGWAAWVVQLVMAVWAISLILSMLILGMDVLLRAAEPTSFFGRWAIIGLFVYVILDRRKEWVNGTKAVATTLADSLTRMTPTSGGFQGGPAVGSSFAEVDKFTGQKIIRPAAMAPVVVAAGVARLAKVAAVAGFKAWLQRRHENRMGEQVRKNTYAALNSTPPNQPFKPPRWP
jgi:hypothetical protein